MLQGLLPIGAVVLFTTAAANQSTPERRRAQVTGYVMTDSNFRTAVDYWFSSRSAAESMYGHISTWETGGVTDMGKLFCDVSSWSECVGPAAASFNEDIGAWDTSEVTDMNHMFAYASAFNTPIGNWDVDKVTDMTGMFNRAASFNQPICAWSLESVTKMVSMFYGASSFNQDLGWCVDDDVEWSASSITPFTDTLCESTSCGVEQRSDCPITGYIMTDSTIRTAVDAWLSNSAAAEATYGHISTWETGGVTDMKCLFAAYAYLCEDYYNSAASYFNDDISAWDTSGVTTMFRMFYWAASFNRPVGGWRVDNVRSMNTMFGGTASMKFNQPLGNWRVDQVTSMQWMFTAPYR